MASSEDAETKREKFETSQLVRREGPIGGLMTFNMEHGYLEAIVRGLKTGYLRDHEYRALTNAESLEDARLSLSDTDYASAIANVSRLAPKTLVRRCQDKWVADFNFMRASAVGALATFLDFMTYEYLIKSISLLISALIKGADVDVVWTELHPLGRSPHLKAVLTFENIESADGLVELYRTVLIDTPVASYFELYFSTELRQDQPAMHIQKVYNEIEIDIIDNMIQKLCLEDFYIYCETLGGTTAALMRELLEFEADRRAILITLNSFNSNLNEAQNRGSERRSLYCNFGKLYPDATMMKFTSVANPQQLAQALAPYKPYADLVAKSDADLRNLPDHLIELETALCRAAFDSQSQFACFYAFVKLKEAEIRNLRHILNCIDMRRDPKEMRWVTLFKDRLEKA